MNPVLIYHNCKANVLNALKRDCLSMPTFNKAELKRFSTFVDRVFEKEIEPILDQFEYDWHQWFNHLDARQQARVATLFKNADVLDDVISEEGLFKREYCMFCKKEKQLADLSDFGNESLPKNRCICGPNEEYKFVMGPVVQALEILFKQQFKGYTSGLSNQQKEELINKWSVDFGKLVQGDGSGFDRTQHSELKDLIEKRIYRSLLQRGKIKHVSERVFESQSQQDSVKVIAKVFQDGKCVNLGYVMKRGGTQSGDCDTSFANTLRMAMYIRYIVEDHMGLDKDSYQLMVAGDDFALFLPDYIDNQVIHDCFYTVFTTKGKDGGLGQILKFLNITDISGFDFCSSEVFYDKNQKKYFVIRKLARFFNLLPFSHKALGMNTATQKQYMLDLYESNNLWCKHMPLVREYNDLLFRYANQLVVGTQKPSKYKEKRILPVEPHLVKFYSYDMNDTVERLTKHMSKDEKYSTYDKYNVISDVEASFTEYLKERYAITQGEIDYCVSVMKASKSDFKPLPLSCLALACKSKPIVDEFYVYSH